jgi:BNR repeat-like domain
MSNHRVPTTVRHSLGLVSLLCLVTVLQGSITQADATFSTPANLSLTTQDSSDQQVASSGSNVYVVWRDNPSNTVLNAEILFARSIDGGKTFAPWENLSATPSTSSAPWVAASGQHVYVIWSEASSGATATDGYYLRYSSDSGATFGAKSNLSTLFGVPTFGNCAMAASGNSVFLSCTQAVSGNNEIVVARSNDNGATFSAPQNVSLSPSAGSAKSRIAASGSNVYVAWEENAASASEIFMASSADSGVSFGTPTNMSQTTGFSSISVTLDADNSKVWLVWSDRSLGNDEVFYRRSTDGGATFSAAENLSSTSSGSSMSFVKGKGSQVWVAWTDPNPAGTLPDVYVRGSSDGGATFSDTLNISNSATINSNQPRIGLTDLAVSLFWGEPASFREVYYSYQELTVSVPPPSMLSLNPGAGMQTQSVDVELTGSGFQSGATLALSGTGVTVTDVAFVSPTSMKAKMNVSLTATPGARDLTVTNPDGQSATLSGAFTVMSASALMLIEITRTDVNMGAGNGGLIATSASDSSNSTYKSLLAHLGNAEEALLQQPVDLPTAINQMDAFYIKIGNMAKGKKPEITPALYMTLYNDYALVMGSLGGTVKPAQ